MEPRRSDSAGGVAVALRPSPPTPFPEGEGRKFENTKTKRVMTTKIQIKGVRAYGYTGYLPEENVLGQWFEVDAELWVDFQSATKSDDIADTYDYRTAISAIESLIQTSKFALIERLAGAIADRLLEDAKIEKLTLRLTKHPPIPNFQGSIQLEIDRDRNQVTERAKETYLDL